MSQKRPLDLSQASEQRGGRRHSNTTGYRQIKRGKTRDQVAVMSKRLKIPLWRRND